MSRKPVYGDDSRFRIVSVANDRWQAERKTGAEHGTREVNQWTPLCRPTSRAAAEAFMNEKVKHANRAT